MSTAHYSIAVKDQEYLTVAQTAARLDISPDAVRRAINRGDIPTQLVGNRHRIAVPDADAYGAGRAQGAPSEMVREVAQAHLDYLAAKKAEEAAFARRSEVITDWYERLPERHRVDMLSAATGEPKKSGGQGISRWQIQRIAAVEKARREGRSEATTHNVYGARARKGNHEE